MQSPVIFGIIGVQGRLYAEKKSIFFKGTDLFFFCNFVTGYTIFIKQENRWKRRMLPKWLLSIKGRTCNPTPLVHDKKTFYEKK